MKDVVKLYRDSLDVAADDAERSPCEQSYEDLRQATEELIEALKSTQQ